MIQHTTTRVTVDGGTLTTLRVGGKRIDLTDRDIVVLHLLAEHKFLTTQQLAKFVHAEERRFNSTVRAVSRWVRKLDEAKLITSKSDRRVGGPRCGSEPQVWHLARFGHDAIETLRQIETGERKKAFKTPTYTFARHRIAINDTKLLLKYIADVNNHVTLGETLIEEKSWRYYTNRSGVATSIRPDLYATTYRGDYKSHWFVEVDCNTESPVRIVAKCNMYLDYLMSTTSNDWCCGVFPAVLWIVPTLKRRNSIRHHLAEHMPAGSLDQLFIVITPQELPALIAEGRLGELEEVEDE